ncbi:MAG TPA: ion transporter [Myxococcaceae bacterium]|nr:ion transporter [Myxococcaceae bacterium]
MSSPDKPLPGPRSRLHTIIFEADTFAGKAFDVTLLCAILLSVLVVMLDSVAEYRLRYGGWLRAAEWCFTVLFTVEYALRLVAVQKPWRYAVSFFGLVDLTAILPTYLSLIIPGAQALLAVRVFRVLRVFRILKLGSFIGQAEILLTALRASRQKIIVFLVAVLSVVVLMGALMYLIEGEKSGFDSIPRGMYWAIVTLTTVGYGDISPKTPVGQLIASAVMILGYGVLAVPTGIVSVELADASRKAAVISTQACPACGRGGHDHDAVHCKYCGVRL